VLNSNLNDVLPDDEDQIPPNGNPHPVNVQPKNNDHNPSNFEDVCDMDHVHQENVNYGWEVPPPPDEEMDWGPWEQQNEENVGDNEIVAVNYLTNVVVAMAAANSFLQHPDQPLAYLSALKQEHSLEHKVFLSLRSYLFPALLALVPGPSLWPAKL
jgi:hypothetical protein